MKYRMDFFGRLFGVPREYLEMAAVYHMPAGARWRYLILPALLGRKIA